MRLSEMDADNMTDEMIEKLLFPGFGYDGREADVIIVLGSRKACEYRIPEAVRIYRTGAAKKLLLCGGNTHGIITECEAMTAAALNRGVKRDDILCENRSVCTVENFTFSKEIIARAMPQCKSVITVTAEYHMRRALLIAESVLCGMEIIPAAVPRGSCTSENWRLTEKGRLTAKSELEKIKKYAVSGMIADREIKY